MAALYAKQHPKKTGRPTKNTSPTERRVSGESKRALERPAQRDAAVTMNVSPPRAEKAAVVLKADPDLAAKVHAGEVKLAQAMRHVKQGATRTRWRRHSGRRTGCSTSSASARRDAGRPPPGADGDPTTRATSRYSG